MYLGCVQISTGSNERLRSTGTDHKTRNDDGYTVILIRDGDWYRLGSGYTGLFLYTELGPISGTKFLSQLAEKIPNGPKIFFLEEKSKFKKVNFPNLAKNYTIFPRNCAIFSKTTLFFSHFQLVPKFPQNVRKSPGTE